MATDSRGVVLVALAGNGAIALAKFGAAWISGSTAMFTEAIHSLVDTGDQVLLLVGQRRGAKPADVTHPLGYGTEIYFWSFVVALMVFLLGGALSVYEGVRQILNPEPVVSPWISMGVLAIAAVFEGTSLRVAYRQYRRVVRGRPTRLWTFIKTSKDPALFSVLLEDSAALIGIGLAATGVIASGFFHIMWADGDASRATLHLSDADHSFHVHARSGRSKPKRGYITGSKALAETEGGEPASVAWIGTFIRGSTLWDETLLLRWQ